jgi:maleate isomerase
MIDFTSLRLSRPLEMLHPLGRVGLVALSTDINIESDLARMYPEGVEFFTTRVRNWNPLTVLNLRKMEGGIGDASGSLLPGTDLDVVIYACTSGAIAIGESRIESLICEGNPGSKVINPARASLEALKFYGARKISVLTPYTESVTREVVGFYEGFGYDVVRMGGFGFEDDTAMSFISLDDIVEASMEICDEESDLLFLSCTALRSSEVLEELEERLGKPVISSNQVLVWLSLRLLSYVGRVEGYGSLLRTGL